MYAKKIKDEEEIKGKRRRRIYEYQPVRTQIGKKNLNEMGFPGFHHLQPISKIKKMYSQINEVIKYKNSGS